MISVLTTAERTDRILWAGLQGLGFFSLGRGRGRGTRQGPGRQPALQVPQQLPGQEESPAEAQRGAEGAEGAAQPLLLRSRLQQPSVLPPRRPRRHQRPRV